MVFTNVFTQLVESVGREGVRIVSSCGGTRSGKTFSALQFLYLLSASDTKPTITSIVSETLPHLKKGAIRDFETIIGHSLDSDPRWKATDHTYTFPSGARIEFFGVDNSAKVHGPARDRLLENEVQNIDYETHRQLAVRTRDFILMDYNPTHSFWANERVETREDCVTIHSTYRDNYDRDTGASLLTDAQVREIESNRTDSNWWRVYGEGKVGVLDGLIYPDFEQVDAMPDASNLVELYGLDFGYTNDPSTLVRVLADTRRKVLYIDEVLYRTHMLNSDIIAFLKESHISRVAEIFADSAEPKSVDEITFAGFNCKGCYKGRTVVEQIQFLKGWTLKVTKRSVNIIRELRGYSWLKDKDGRTLNEPNKGAHLDHALDALRYAVYTKFATFKRPLTGGRAKTGSAW